jgi:uncharacterized membrane protein
MKTALAILVILAISSFAMTVTAASPSGAAYVRSTTLSVFSDGTAEINQTLSLTNMSSLKIPLLSPQVGNILAVSERGTAVPYEISGGNITLSTFGVSRMSLAYDTDGLTSKQGSVWDLVIDSPYNITLALPYQSTVLSVSRAVSSYSTVEGKPTLSLASGSWQVSYGLPVYNQATTTAAVDSTSSATGSAAGTPATFQLSQLSYLAVVLAAAAAGVGIYVYRSRTALEGFELRPDDKVILDFVREHGGVVTEVEIRERFSLPRTSAWRQAKRLEKMGLVKITKVGKQNRVELVLDRPPE